jgi:hypothetical protein
MSGDSYKIVDQEQVFNAEEYVFIRAMDYAGGKGLDTISKI